MKVRDLEGYELSYADYDNHDETKSAPGRVETPEMSGAASLKVTRCRRRPIIADKTGAGHAAGDDGAEFGMAEESGIATPSTGDPVRPGRAREGKKLLRDIRAPLTDLAVAV